MSREKNKNKKGLTVAGISIAVGVFATIITYFVVGFTKANTIFKELNEKYGTKK
jgi:hypothetical protein